MQVEYDRGSRAARRLAPVLKTIFTNVSYHIHVHVASLTLMALF